MRYRYLIDFRRGISVFVIFSYGIAVLGTPPMSPSRIYKHLISKNNNVDIKFCKENTAMLIVLR